MDLALLTKEDIVVSFDESMKQLVIMISSFSDDDFNRQPFEGSWTAGEVSEHLYKSISGLPGLFLTETKDAGRDPLEKCEVIASIFLNFEKKLKSPDFILPSNEPKRVHFFANAFEKTVGEIRILTGEKELTKLYTRFPFPQMGHLTGWEWIFFATAHAIRHTRQLKNIREHLQS